MSFVYFTEPGSFAGISENQIEYQQKNELTTFVPLETVEGVVVVGKIQLSTALIDELLVRKIPVSFLSSTGRYFGKLESTQNVDPLRQAMQYAFLNDQDAVLAFSKRIIVGKIHNQKVMLRRFARNHPPRTSIRPILDEMKNMEEKLLRSQSRNEIMGIEGYAAKEYYRGISSILAEEFDFHDRNRRPPKDPMNSLLSLGSTLLMYEIYNALTLKGLNPYVGVLHQLRKGHPALASDLMEEWRPALVDSLSFHLLQNGGIKLDDFVVDTESHGVFLQRPALKKFLKQYEERIRTKNSYIMGPESQEEAFSFRKGISRQIDSYIRAVTDADALCYRPVLLR